MKEDQWVSIFRRSRYANVPPEALKHHKAGLVGPAFLAWNWFRSILFRSPAQNVKISVSPLRTEISIRNLIPILRRRFTGPRRVVLTSPSRDSPTQTAGQAERTRPSPHGQLHPEPLSEKLRSRAPSETPATVRRPRKNRSCRLATDRCATPPVRWP